MENKLIALYCRVSTDIQKEKGESIINQKSRLQEYAKEKHLSAIVYEDAGYSAKDTNRPAINRLIREIKEGKISSVIVTKLDRITRSIKDLLELLELFEEHEVAFKSLTQPLDTSTAMGRGFLRLLGEFAQMEREMISERVGEDMRHRAKNGKWNGGVIPYGYTTNSLEFKKLMNSRLPKEKAETKANRIAPEKKKLYINRNEARVVRKIYEKYVELESLRAVTHWLNSNGYKTRNNKTWASASIERIITNPTYIGKIWYNKKVSSKTTGKLKKRPREEWIVCKGLHKPIIEEKLFNKAQKIKKRQTREPRRKMSNYLLSSLVRCGKCGGSVNGYTQKKITPKGEEQLYPYYKCHTRHSKGSSVCKGNTIRKDTLERLVIGKILELIESDKFNVDIKHALNIFSKKVKQGGKSLRSEKKRLEQRNNKIGLKKRNLLEALEDKTIDKEIYKMRIAELNSEYDKNQKSLYEVESRINDIGIEDVSFNSVYEILKNFRESWKNLGYSGKKNLLWSLISKITVNDKKIKIDLFFLPSLFSNISSCTDMGSLHQPALFLPEM